MYKKDILTDHGSVYDRIKTDHYAILLRHKRDDNLPDYSVIIDQFDDRGMLIFFGRAYSYDSYLDAFRKARISLNRDIFESI